MRTLRYLPSQIGTTMYSTLVSYLFRLSQFAVWIGGSMMLISAVMVTVDVIARKFFGASLGGADELSGYLFAIATAFALPYAALHRANVRIDVLYMRLPRLAQAWLDILGMALMAAFAGIVTWRALATVALTWSNGAHSITPLHTPLIVPQGLWVTGWVLFCLTLLCLLGGMITALVRGQFDRLQALGGALSMDEEIEEELHGVRPNPHGANSTAQAVPAGE